MNGNPVQFIPSAVPVVLNWSPRVSPCPRPSLPKLALTGADSFKTSIRASVDAHPQPSTDVPSSNRPIPPSLSVQADALVAALSRRARRRRKGK